MRNFVIFVEGENFNLEYEGAIQPTGFFTSRRIEAENEEEATEAILEQLKNEPELNVNTIAKSNIKPSITVKVIHEMPLEHKNKYSGFTFYSMEGE